MNNELDIEDPQALGHYLREQGWINEREDPEMRVLAGGVSNRTVLVRWSSGEEWVLKQALAKLRVTVDWFSSPERIHREALGLRWLASLAPEGTITPFLFEDHECHLLAMQAVSQPHQNWKTLLLAGQIENDHSEQFGRLLGSIHRESAVRSQEVAPLFADTTFFETLRIEPYYRFTAAHMPAAADFLHALIDETHACRLTLVHGDYSPKNVLVHDGRLILLDHEVIHFGDPAFDLGFSLTHLLSKAHHLPQHRQAFADAIHTYWQAYREALGDVPWANELEERVVRHTLSCLLARVVGRSPLEYLTDAERARQSTVALELMGQQPDTFSDMLHCFLERIDTYEQNKAFHEPGDSR